RAAPHRHHRCARRAHRYHAPPSSDGRVPALAPPARVGPGRDRAARRGRRVRDVGRCQRDDDPQGAVGVSLPAGGQIGERRSQAARGAGLARPVDLQPFFFRRGGIRVGAPPGLPQGSESPRVSRRGRAQRAGAPTVNRAPLGVFDSGIGGLTVARALFERLPRESVIYFGDTARVPYGPKSPDTVRRYAGESGAYERAIKALRPDTPVCAQACPLFVPLVEEGWFDHPATELIARQYLEPLQRAGVDVLVLGCTHYPLLKPLLARVLGPGVTLVDSAEETAKAVTQALEQGGLTTAPDAAAIHRFVVSDDEPHFRKVGARFLGEKLQIVEVVPLG